MNRIVAAGLLALAVFGCRNQDRPPAEPAGQVAETSAGKPELALLTSLPIAFPETFALEAPVHPVMTELTRGFRVRLVDGPEELKPGGLLLAAHPRALPAERLVALDRWVRNGGRLLLLADPQLAWPSERPLGDPLRPPPAFADTGLLRHWGLTLFAPDAAGPREGRIAGLTVLTASPGTLTSLGDSCRVEPGGLVGHCLIGQGQVTIIADADFLNVGGVGALDGPITGNLPALTKTLRALQ